MDDKIHTELLEAQYDAIQNELEVNEALIEERDRELKKLEEEMILLNEMYKDLANLGFVQAQRINLMEKQIGEAVAETAEAVEELKEAYKLSGNIWMPVMAGLIGGVLGGPVGVLIGLKSNLLLGGCAVGGTVLGYTVGGLL